VKKSILPFVTHEISFYRILRWRIEAAGRKIKDHDKMLEQTVIRKYCRHRLLVTFDLDDLSRGAPKISSVPKETFSMKSPFRIDFAFKKNGETTQIQGLVIKNQT
jgi:hypothetical protein